MHTATRRGYRVFDYRIRISIQRISVQIHLANRMTLGVSNVRRIQFGFGFIVNPDPDPIIEYVLRLDNRVSADVYERPVTCTTKAG